jgi:hypothetical protein
VTGAGADDASPAGIFGSGASGGGVSWAESKLPASPTAAIEKNKNVGFTALWMAARPFAVKPA